MWYHGLGTDAARHAGIRGLTTRAALQGGAEERDFYYHPSKREPWTRIPSDTLILAHHGWHYTAAVRRRGTGEQAGDQTAARATTPSDAGLPSLRWVDESYAIQRALQGWAHDRNYGLVNFGNTCTVNALAQAVLCPIVEDLGPTFEAWDPEGTTLCNSLIGASSEREPGGRAAASAALKAAMEDGGGELQQMVLGNNGPEPWPQLDMEDMLERSLTMIRQEEPGVMRCIDWHIACQGMCCNVDCRRYGRSGTANVSCNPVVMQPCPTGRDDAQDMLNRLRTITESTPRPCPDCSVDMEPTGARYVHGTPHILIIHAQRARHDATRDSSRWRRNRGHPSRQSPHADPRGMIGQLGSRSVAFRSGPGMQRQHGFCGFGRSRGTRP